VCAPADPHTQKNETKRFHDVIRPTPRKRGSVEFFLRGQIACLSVLR